MTEASLSLDDIRSKMIAESGDNIIFDGFSPAAFEGTARDAGVSLSDARSAFPKGMLGIAIAAHDAGDKELAKRIASEDMSTLRYSQKVARGIMIRLEIASENKEAVRRASSFFALPQNAGQGTKCIWNTADTIWTALGDTSDDFNWYSKRAILSGVYSASLLYWLGDDSPDMSATQAFVDRRIAGVMQFEKTKAQVTNSRAWRAFRSGPGQILDRIRPPRPSQLNNLPGRWQR